MTSELAIAEIARLEDEGLRPSARDIIRLNALALQFEAAKASRVLDSSFFLPRCVVIAKDIYIREPAIGHEIWLAAFSRHVRLYDIDTVKSIRAYVYSRDPEELPDPNLVDAVQKELDKFAKQCAKLSRQQLYAAVEYVETAFDPCSYEFSSSAKNQPEMKNDVGCVDVDECLSLGLLNQGKAVLWGISAAELRRMRRRELQAVIDRALRIHDPHRGTDEGMESLGKFNRALDEIEERLRKEKEIEK